MFSNQTDQTGKFMNLVIAHCVIAQVRYMVSRHMVFEVVACLLCRIYILVLFGSSWAYYNCQFRTWIFLGFMNNTQVSYFAIFWSVMLSGCILYSRFRIGHLKYTCNHVMSTVSNFGILCLFFRVVLFVMLIAIHCGSGGDTCIFVGVIEITQY